MPLRRLAKPEHSRLPRRPNAAFATHRMRQLFDRRRSGRTRAGRVACDLGEVLNLSSGGVRLRCARRIRGRHRAGLTSTGRTIRVWAEVRWAKREGLRRFTVGLEFVALDAETAARLEQFASVC